MGGRLLLLFVVVVALAVPSSTLRYSIPSDVVDRCRNTVGPQAAEDLQKVVPELLTCIRFESLKDEIQRTMLTGNMKEAITTVCRKKDELLPCFDEVFEKVKRCVYEDEQEGITVLERLLEPTIDFVCEHADDFVAMLTSQDELQCVSRVTAGMKRCYPYKSNDALQLLDSLKSQEQRCKDLDGFMDCVTAIDGNCRNSIVVRIYNDMKKELIDDVICLKKVQGSGAAAVMVPVGTLLEPLGRFILAVTVPYMLRF